MYPRKKKSGNKTAEKRQRGKDFVRLTGKGRTDGLLRSMTNNKIMSVIRGKDQKKTGGEKKKNKVRRYKKEDLSPAAEGGERREVSIWGKS